MSYTEDAYRCLLCAPPTEQDTSKQRYGKTRCRNIRGMLAHLRDVHGIKDTECGKHYTPDGYIVYQEHPGGVYRSHRKLLETLTDDED